MTYKNLPILVTIATFNTLNEAYNAKNLLETNGITCFLENESLNALYVNALGGVKLKISPTEYDKAHKILYPKTENELARKTDDLRFFVCPSCGQLNEEVKLQSNRYGFLGQLMRGLGLDSPKVICGFCNDSFEKKDLFRK
jgi:hypothetical protein